MEFIRSILAGLSRKTQVDVFSVWRYDQFLKTVIKILWVVIFILVFVIYLLYRGWSNAPTLERFHVSPTLAQIGGQITPNTVTKSDVFNFGYQIFVSLHTFPDSVAKNYPENVKHFQYYLSANYRKSVIEDMNLQINDLVNNTASHTYTLMNNIFSDTYINQHVTEVRPHIWDVSFILKEQITAANLSISSTYKQYTLQVSMVAPNVQYNVFGLQLDGVVSVKELTQEEVNALLS